MLVHQIIAGDSVYDSKGIDVYGHTYGSFAVTVDNKGTNDETDMGSLIQGYDVGVSMDLYSNIITATVTNKRIDLTESVTLVPEIHLGWAHEWLDGSHAITASFVGSGTGGVNIIDRPLPDDSASIGTALAILLGDRTALTATYDADFGRSDFITHIVNLDVDFHF